MLKHTTDPIFSLVVLSWNNLELTKRCAASLRQHTDVPFELIIVDNGSDDGSAEYAESSADLPVLNNANLGFAPGMNAGLQKARGKYVAFINNDTEFPEGWANNILDTLESRPDAGIVLPAVTAAGNPVSVRSTPGDAVIRMRRFKDLPSGVVYCMSRVTVTALGGWDERYELASREDLDLLFAVWCNGLEVYLDERVVISHEGSATARTHLPDRDQTWARNWEIFVTKWTGSEPTGIQRLPTVDEAQFRWNLETASVAAHWMDRWYSAWEQERDLRKQLREAEKEVPGEAQVPAGSKSRWAFFRHQLSQLKSRLSNS